MATLPHLATRRDRARQLLGAAALLAATFHAAAQDSTATDSARPAVAPAHCPNSADPRKRSLPCNTGPGSAFDKDHDTFAADWVGARRWMMEEGVTPTLSMTVQPMTSDATVAGGRGWSWVTQVNLGIAVDLGTVTLTHGLQLYAGMAYGSGPSLSEEIGSLFTVQGAGIGYGFWVGEIYLQETLDDGRLTLALGRLAPSASFAAIPVSGNYLNSAIAWGNPNALGIDDPQFTSFPAGIQWGVQGVYALTPEWEVGLGVYNNNPNATNGENHGLALKLQEGNVGALTAVRVRYLRNQGAGARGLPGQYSLGVYYDGNRFAVLPAGTDSVTGMYNLYAMFQQRVTTIGAPADERGLTVWAAASYTSRSIIATMPVSMSVGVSAAGPVDRRDVASLGVYYGGVSRHFPGASREFALELNYQVAIRRWLSITPDVQYISRPGGTSASLADVTVFGAQVALVF